MARQIPRFVHDWQLDMLDIAGVGNGMIHDYLQYIAPEERRQREDFEYMELYNAREYQKRYRLTKDTVNEIMTRVQGELDTGHVGGLNVSELVHPTLRYYATGTFQSAVGDMCGNVHQTSISRTIRQVSRVIATNYKEECIRMPNTPQEIHEVMQSFYDIAGMPYTLASVDGSHVCILGRGGEFGELYRNRKGYFSLNIQAACDPILKIRDLVTRWFGSCHDSTVFGNSRLRADLELLRYGQRCFVLGDNGYSNLPYLLTPFLKPTNRQERRYNAAHKSTRNTVERMFGVWYRRFPCLSLGIRLKDLQDIQAVIMTTACLHNIAISAREQEPEDEQEVVQRVARWRRRHPQPQNVRRDERLPLNISRREQIVREFF
ncbi:hypothetical protein B566_EDAN016687 [Ephemera danica]|nr:hypothetical protein B566_EDAN016687 [Ephemera danica]